MKEESGHFFSRYDEACVPVGSSMRQAVQSLSKAGALLTCLVDVDHRLIGIMTDSDVRESLLKGAKLDDAALTWANIAPQVASAALPTRALRQLALDSGKREIPLMDQHGRIVDVFVLGLYDIRRAAGDLSLPMNSGRVLPNAAFILAGGKGTRLRSAVADRPKPLALVGDRPLLGILMDQLVQSGVQKFYVSVNYMAEQIESYLRASKYQHLDVHFVHEPRPLGTAGSIGYIKHELTAPMLVCNGDVLSLLPFAAVLNYHTAHEADITCILRPHRVTIPFGVFDVSDHVIKGIQEKPEVTYLVNAGIYVLSPRICQELPVGEYIDMPEVVKGALANNRRVIPFFLHEYWIDIGRPEDYRKANEEYESVFQEQNHARS